MCAAAPCDEPTQRKRSLHNRGFSRNESWRAQLASKGRERATGTGDRTIWLLGLTPSTSQQRKEAHAYGAKCLNDTYE